MFRKARNAIRISSGIRAEGEQHRGIVQLLRVLLCNVEGFLVRFSCRVLHHTVVVRIRIEDGLEWLVRYKSKERRFYPLRVLRESVERFFNLQSGHVIDLLAL